MGDELGRREEIIEALLFLTIDGFLPAASLLLAKVTTNK